MFLWKCQLNYLYIMESTEDIGKGFYRGKRRVNISRRSRAVAGAAGYCLPHFLADIMEVIVDRKNFAAHRAAK
jgi:hypothetical protein